MKTTQPALDQQLVKALSHPLRVQLLKLLHDEVASPNELAKKTGEPLGNVSYHIRILAKLDCIELVRTEPRRGAVEHFYRPTVLPWLDKVSTTEVPESLRESISGEILSMIVGDAVEALKAGTFDKRTDNHISRAPIALDEQAWGEVAELLDGVLARVLELRAEAADRAVENDTVDQLIPCEVAILHFQRPKGDAELPA